MMMVRPRGNLVSWWMIIDLVGLGKSATCLSVITHAVQLFGESEGRWYLACGEEVSSLGMSMSSNCGWGVVWFSFGDACQSNDYHATKLYKSSVNSTLAMY